MENRRSSWWTRYGFMVARNGNSAQLQRWGFLHKEWTSWGSQNTVTGSLKLHFWVFPTVITFDGLSIHRDNPLNILASVPWPCHFPCLFLQPLLIHLPPHGLIRKLAILSNCTAFKIVIFQHPTFIPLISTPTPTFLYSYQHLKPTDFTTFSLSLTTASFPSQPPCFSLYPAWIL